MSSAGLRVTGRFVLHLGTRCNARCPFCYFSTQQRTGADGELTLRRARRRVDLAARWGKTAVDLSGGEPTLHPHLEDIVAHCRRRGIERVTLITNGLRTAAADRCSALADAGLTDVILSVHGHAAALHETHTGVPGSWRRVVQSFANLRGLDLGVRVNTVLTQRNLEHVERLLGWLATMAPDELNLLVCNPSQAAASAAGAQPFRVVDYPAAGRAISHALDRHGDLLPPVNIRFLPFCCVPDHAGRVRTQWQKLFEAHEWDPVLHVAFQRGAAAALAAIVAGAVMTSSGPRRRCADVQTWAALRLSRCRMRMYYVHGAPCAACALRRICTGFPRALVAEHGFPRVRPARRGRLIGDPQHFVSGAGCETMGRRVRRR
jgi:pyruvate-formate lyase-activating enzyme